MATCSLTHSIKNIVITAGTHGNEMSGIAAVHYWEQQPQAIENTAPSATIKLELVNKAAIQARARFIDEDLNRQFSMDKLAQSTPHSTCNEVEIAHVFNNQYGPKGNAKTDFCIDIHNTTSNMGPTLIVLENDEFHRQLARFVKNKMPSSIILVEDYQAFAEFGYLCTVAKKGVMVEVGPQVQGALRASVYQQTVEMTIAILSFIEQYNIEGLPVLEPVEAFRLGTEIAYPCDNNQKTAMIHPSLDGKDFLSLEPNQPCFIDFEGNDILWEGEKTYPHFIGEAAYDHLHLAFASSTKFFF